MLNVAVCAFSSTSRCTDQTRSFPCAVSSATVYISDRLSASDCTELCIVCPPHLSRDLCSSPTCGISTPGWNQKQMAKRRERLKLRLK